METKGAEDVLGGADSWKNVDKTEGKQACAVGCDKRDENKYTDCQQPNVRAKVASAAWPTSDRCRFAVPMSLPRASTSVWSVLRSGVRTDQIVYCT
jgi:7-cyano-7-deazaguanine synthase in queuosine biosynthesis